MKGIWDMMITLGRGERKARGEFMVDFEEMKRCILSVAPLHAKGEKRVWSSFADLCT